MTTFTLQDVASKSTQSSGYIAIDNKVYEITDYMSKHPGGDDILAEVLGTDATQAFHEVGHSEEAMEQLKQLLAGELHVSKKENTATVKRLSGLYMWVVSVFGVGLLSILAFFYVNIASVQ
ncbi:Cytochrome b5 heme-binding domain-containing protein [Fusarium keratoplasticum]|uniref:Cytochrome b5 heme-binding domain-containing protein n=1 Tax=Fusarium keratoplasticum TaxID=1328300 RepID=A0ACC0QZD0_9HYPO|nr:Cytochrome b5 heme-binding domain-containing protein [Fusarium keratoplasticum]KAI8669136.1 Cytochrome b5 heme-binding domain-containing protein [Fusarium keratoplasticum]